MPKGGKREGAGRKVSNATLISQKLREKLLKEIDKKWDPLIKAKFDLALGHFEAVKDKDGRILDVYFVKPDAQSARYLIDQSIGKAKESIEHSGEVKTFADIVGELDSQ